MQPARKTWYIKPAEITAKTYIFLYSALRNHENPSLLLNCRNRVPHVRLLKPFKMPYNMMFFSLNSMGRIYRHNRQS